jgi:hypothetical protein
MHELSRSGESPATDGGCRCVGGVIVVTQFATTTPKTLALQEIRGRGVARRNTRRHRQAAPLPSNRDRHVGADRFRPADHAPVTESCR